jgi:hypothetical protein
MIVDNRDGIESAKSEPMNAARDSDEAFQVEFLQVYVEDNGTIDCDILEVSEDTWVIHGVIPYGGEVPMAVFHSYDEARHALDQFRAPPDVTDER